MSTNQFRKKLGQFFKQKRKDCKISCRKMSEKTGLHMGTIHKFEHGTSNISFVNLIKISEVIIQKNIFITEDLITFMNTNLEENSK